MRPSKFANDPYEKINNNDNIEFLRFAGLDLDLDR